MGHATHITTTPDRTMQPDAADPIVAVSSPPGRSLRGIVRISAPRLAPLLPALLDPPPPPRQLSPARLKLTADRTLPVLAAFSPGPRSFTAQDVLELQCPGNPALLEQIVARVLDQLRSTLDRGRLAEPGEFTQRAFAAGRIDLTRAEGIAATISAVSDAQLRAAALLRTGRLGQWAEQLVDRLATTLALVEAGIDFVDQDDVVPITPAALDAALAELAADLDRMITQSRSWSTLEALPRVVLIGEPNVGKSTLFNALLGRRRAVTSAIAGTTRDVLSEPMRLGDAEVMLVDVAGLDVPEAALDRAMQAAAHDAIDRADLLLMLSSTDDFAPPPRANVPILRVRTKADLAPASPSADHAVSAHTGEGLDQLRAKLTAALSDRAVSLTGQALALQPRHRDELQAAVAALQQARTMLAPQLTAHALADMELIADRLRDALDHLGALGGQMTPDDILGKVFSTFCIGK
ncbi:MAG: GTPase [Phycisphaeraceae bacterium]